MHTFIALRRTAASAILSTALILAGCSEAGGEWVVSNEVDAMTDVQISKAITTVRGTNFDLEVTVACGATGKLAYQFRTFDKSGDAASLKMDDIHGSVGKIAVVRVDGGKPYSHWDFSRFANQVLMTGREASDMAAGTMVALRLRLVNGGETYTLDQSEAQFRSMLQACQPAESAGPSVPRDAVTDPAAPSGDGQSSQPPTGEGTTDASDAAPASEDAECWNPPSGSSIDDPDRPISSDELQEIEKVTGRPFETGDSIYGRAEDRCRA